MRTKTLLLTATLGAAGIAGAGGGRSARRRFSRHGGHAASQARSPRRRARPYCRPGGFTRDAGDRAGPHCRRLLRPAGVPVGTTVYKYDGATGFSSSVNFGTWTPDLTLVPGEGAFIQLAAPATLTFVGEVTLGAASNHQVPAGFSIQGSSVPQSDKLEALQFPADLGDTVYFYRGGAYVSSAFFGTWVPDAIPALGEGFFVNKGTAATWTRSFAIP